jgi:hypothetical protein
MRDIATIDRQIAQLQAELTALRRIKYASSRAMVRKMHEESPRIQAIKKYYIANQASVAEIAQAFNTSSGAIQALVLKYDWPRRSPPKVNGQKRRRGRNDQSRTHARTLA